MSLAECSQFSQPDEGLTPRVCAASCRGGWLGGAESFCQGAARSCGRKRSPRG